MTNLVISNQIISQDKNGFFSLNDLHKSAGGASKHQPSNFMRNEQTKELIKEIELENSNSSNLMSIAYSTSEGKKGGTFVCRELVLAYAMWISAKFNLMVIRAFDALNTGAVPCLPRLTSEDTLPLRNAVNMATGVLKLDYSTIYKMVHQRFGICDNSKSSKIKQLSHEQIPQAVEYVHSLMVQSQKATSTPNHEAIIANTHNLVWHTMHIYRWYNGMKEAFYALSPQIAGGVHDHILEAKSDANRLHRLLGFEFDKDCPRRLN